MKLKGFTLIELIVVIAIIAILAAILVPSMLGYVHRSRVSRMNSNARSVYEGAQLAITDINVSNYAGITPNCVYTGTSDCIGHANVAGAQDCNLIDYLGENFEGNFLFLTNAEGSGCVYALWSDKPIPASSASHMTMDDVKGSVNTALPMGCHPLKTDDDNP